MIVRLIAAIGSDFEHSGVSITWVILGLQNSFKLGYPGLSQAILLTCTGISRHIPSCTELSSKEISQDIPRYPKTRFLSWDIQLQVFCFGLSRPGYPGISPVVMVVFPDVILEFESIIWIIWKLSELLRSF